MTTEEFDEAFHGIIGPAFYEAYLSRLGNFPEHPNLRFSS